MGRTVAVTGITPRAMDVGDGAARALGVTTERFAEFVARHDWRLR